MSSSWRPQPSVRFRKHRNRRRFIFGTLIALGAILILAGVIWGFGFLNVKSVKVSSVKFIDSEKFKNQIDNYLNANNFFGLINFRKNELFISRKDFNFLLNQFPELESFTLTKNLFSRELIFNLNERQSEGIVCEDNPVQKCFYFDKSGFVFTEAPETGGSIIFLINDGSGRLYKIGDEILSADNFQIFSKTRDLVNARFPVGSIFIGSDGAEIRVNAGWSIKINLEDLSRTYLALENLLRGGFDFNSLSYVDLRYLPNIYYK